MGRNFRKCDSLRLSRFLPSRLLQSKVFYFHSAFKCQVLLISLEEWYTEEQQSFSNFFSSFIQFPPNFSAGFSLTVSIDRPSLVESHWKQKCKFVHSYGSWCEGKMYNCKLKTPLHNYRLNILHQGIIRQLFSVASQLVKCLFGFISCMGTLIRWKI